MARPVPLPEGCVSSTPAVFGSRCVWSAQCPRNRETTQCDRLPWGRWRCYCVNDSDAMNDITGVDGLDACVATAHLCHDGPAELGDVPLELGDYACVPISSSDEDTRGMEISCGRPVLTKLPAGVSARLADTTASSCPRLEDGSFDCTCLRGRDEAWYDVQADSAASACGTLVEFCRGTEAALTNKPETCLGSEYTSDNGCDIAQRARSIVARSSTSASTSAEVGV